MNNMFEKFKLLWVKLKFVYQILSWITPFITLILSFFVFLGKPAFCNVNLDRFFVMKDKIFTYTQDNLIKLKNNKPQCEYVSSFATFSKDQKYFQFRGVFIVVGDEMGNPKRDKNGQIIVVDIKEKNPNLYKEPIFLDKNTAKLLKKAAEKGSIIMNVKVINEKLFEITFSDLLKTSQETGIYKRESYPAMNYVFTQSNLKIDNGNLEFIIRGKYIIAGVNITAVNPLPECIDGLNNNLQILASNVNNEIQSLSENDIVLLLQTASDIFNSK